MQVSHNGKEIKVILKDIVAIMGSSDEPTSYKSILNDKYLKIN